MGKPTVAREVPLTLADLKITVEIFRNPWSLGEAQDVNLEELAHFLQRPGGLNGLWYDLRGFVDVLDDLTDRNEPGPVLLGQIRSLAAGLRGILNEGQPR
jgi:hypothetical protein